MKALDDLRNLMDFVVDSDVLVLMLTDGVLTRPWCVVELYTALTRGVPVIFLNVNNSYPFDHAGMRAFLESFPAKADLVNPGIRGLIDELHLDIARVGRVLLDGLVLRRDILRSELRPNGTLNQIKSEMHQLKEHMELACRRAQKELKRALQQEMIGSELHDSSNRDVKTEVAASTEGREEKRGAEESKNMEARIAHAPGGEVGRSQMATPQSKTDGAATANSQLLVATVNRNRRFPRRVAPLAAPPSAAAESKISEKT